MIRMAELFDRTEIRAIRRLLPEGSEAEPVAALARTAWSSLAEPGDAVASSLIERLGAAEALAHVVASTPAAELPGSADDDTASVQAGLDRWRPRLDRGLLARRLDIAHRLGARLLQPGCESWPEALDDLGPHAPLVLWVRGDPEALRTPRQLALVGARAATGYGEHVAAELAAGASERGVLVVSGGAFGIDAVAHRAALGAGGRTVAFLAGGADRLYPTAHSELLHRIIATPGCAVATEVPPGTTPTRWRFLQRNRLIAASTAATVVVEAGARSGSLNTAGHAASLGRPLGAVPGPVTSASSAGCHRLLREFDAICVTSTAEVLDLVGIGSTPERETALTGAAARVLDALRGRGAHEVADVARDAGLSVSDALGLLGGLLADGAVHRSEDGRWTVAGR